MNIQNGQQTKPTATLTLRPVSPDDEPFLLEVYASIRADELALVPWTDEQKQVFLLMQLKAQHEHYRSVYPGAAFQLILWGGMSVGRLYVARGEDEIRILDITLLPQYRNRGIGSALIEQLIAEAVAPGKAVSIHVESFNPSLRLFQRLGFSKREENGINFLMEWQRSA